jgi:hypothetical protein
VIGAPRLSTSWFFPEGCTRDNFDEYICVANPGGDEAHVTFTFKLETGDTVTRKVDIAPNQRTTVLVPAITGRGHDVSTQVSADRLVIAERPMYFNYDSIWDGGHCVVGYAP